MNLIAATAAKCSIAGWPALAVDTYAKPALACSLKRTEHELGGGRAGHDFPECDASKWKP